MKLAIAEKRDVSRKIAKVLGAGTDKKDWFEGSGWCIAWCQGHLLELRVPESDGRWDIAKLPIIPERFQLGPVSNGRDKDGKPVDDLGARHRLKVIRELMTRCDEVVCCTDAGREGQLIFDNVYRYTGIRKPAKRLWISSLTEKAIREGFQNLADNRDYDELAEAARKRSEADWVVGVNATRAFTLSTGARKVLSLGRVQTPTLCMVCRRYVENVNFKSSPFWVLRGQSTKDGITFSWKCEKNYEDRDVCEANRNAVVNAGYLDVVSVNTERKNEDPPLLHDIASLQKAANSKYGLTAKQTLAAAQSLYEKQLISYPRTGSRYISEDIFQEVPSLLKSLAWHPVYGGMAVSLAESGSLNRRSVDGTKVTDHHGFIVTGNEPDRDLGTVETQIYELVLTRFIEAFSAACVADVTTVEMTSCGVDFIAKGRKELFLGWHGVLKETPAEEVAMEDVDNMEMTMCPLPKMSSGDRIPVGKLEMIEEKTRPKPLLTDATLLSAMENAGRQCNDKSVAKALKGVGIGTPATRDSIIEELVHRTYIVREKKKLRPTELGLTVYNAVKDKKIANVEMTAEWETALEQIAEGVQDSSGFSDSIRKYTVQITDELKEIKNADKIGDQSEGPSVVCPRCHTTARIGPKGVFCNCGLKVWRTVCDKRLTDQQLEKLLTTGRTDIVKGFKKKDGSSFNAALGINREWQVVFVRPETGPDEPVACPRCGQTVKFNEKGAWCPSCRLSLWRECYGKRLTDSQLKDLLTKRRTERLKGFVSKTGNSYEAMLVLNDDWKVTLDFESKK